MGSKVKLDPDVDSGWHKLDCQLSEGCKGVRDDVAVEGQGPSQEGMLKIVGDVIGCDGMRSIQFSSQGNWQNVWPPLPLPPSQPPPSSLSQKPQPPVGPVVRWERFLPLQSLKVLLVENDDSTCHVVSALLRNCSYEVTTAANGLEAWKFLEDLNYHIDLVLSEVAMPGLSGIGLLSKIMGHRTCKHIPVIMMSSHDSMAVVFKCLSKGAVDFLVKPIRKNELKNLWQHVWRRCHTLQSSGSGSESCVQAHEPVKSMSVGESDASSGSNDEDEDSSIGLNAGDGSDNGSGTQNSWTKHAAEVESPQLASQQDHQLAGSCGGTCVQVTHPKTETICNEWTPMSGNKNCQAKDFIDDESLGKDLERKMPKEASTHAECFPREKVHPSITGSSMEFVTEETAKNNQTPSALEQESIKATCERSAQAAHLIGAITNTINSQILSKSSKAFNGTPEILAGKDNDDHDATELPSLELSLKRQISVRDGEPASSNRNILWHSDHSAFSRYNVSTASKQVPEALEGTNEHTNHINMELKKSNDFIRPPPLTEKSKTVLAVKGTHLSAFHPLRPRSSGTEEVQEKADDIESATVVQPKGICVQVEHHHHHYHHHHIHGMQHPPQLQHAGDQEQYELKNMTSAVPQCGSSNVYGGQIECNTANCSVNGSFSGSNHGSNVLNVNSAVANTVGINTEDSGAAVKSGGEDNNANASHSGSAVNHTHIAQREAALNKFRQKRKERCFEKKVRYQSRKKLAEQRPRLRGQFVRQTTREQKDHDGH